MFLVFQQTFSCRCLLPRWSGCSPCAGQFPTVLLAPPLQQWIFVTLDLNPAAANPRLSPAPGRGGAGGFVGGQSPDDWRVTGLKNLLSHWSLLSAFCQLTVSKAECTPLVLCVRMPCRGGKARLVLVQGLLVVGAGSKDRAACWLAPTLSKAPCCLQRSTIGLHPNNLTKASSCSRKLRAKLLFSAGSSRYCDRGTKPVLVHFCPNHSLWPSWLRQWSTLAAAETKLRLCQK